ncbi:MAG: methyl-accepting chemotaxis protein [Betaproteobacteria bacterium]|nr:methyl-accepting chemotaxis protein [Betaproteobacteria bacterium]
MSDRATTALRLQGDTDMMHDAIRGDVLERFLKGAQASPAKVHEMMATFDEHAKTMSGNMAEMEALDLEGAVEESLQAAKPVVAAYLDAGAAAMKMEGNERDEPRLQVFLQKWEALVSPLEQLGEHIDADAKAAKAAAETGVRQAYWGMGIGLVFSIVLGIVATVVLRRKITKPLKDVVLLSNAVAQGDLTHPLPEGGREEIGEVVKAVGAMQSKFTEALKSVRAASDALEATSEELVNGSREVAGSSQTQSEAAMTMAAGVEQLTASINEVSEGATEAHTVSHAASEQCAQSESLVRKVLADMSELQASVKDSAQVIHSLGEQSRSIRAIVQVIKDIADQTNLLALNAAIEAARAGEQGRGFAVVADEVRKLADRTGQSTQQIATMIDAIQGSVDAAVAGMSNGVALVDRGSACAQEAAEAMSQVNVGVLKILGVVDSAAHAMKEQAAAANESAEAVSEVAASAERNSNVARTAAASAEQLHYLADGIKQAVAQFRLQGDPPAQEKPSKQEGLTQRSTADTVELF